MGGSTAMLAFVVREAIGKIAAPEVADKIERAALQRSSCDALPEEALALARFVDGALYETIADYLGEDMAEAVRSDLEPILANIEGVSGVLDVSAHRPVEAVSDELPGMSEARELTSAISEMLRPEEVSEASRASEARPTTSKSRVLLADEDPQLLEATARELRAEGFEVVTASDGYAALELCQSMGPDVVVADLHMPAISGRQLITTLHRTMGRGAPPVILITGNVFAPTNIEGAAEVIRKPLDIEDLATAIELAAWDHAAGI